MASAAQITANQANAQHSTGPVTPEGKARVSQNAVRHGLTAKHLVIRDDEREEFESLRADLLTELDPQGAVETLTFNELLHAAWNLHRFRRLEAESTAAIDDPIFDRLGRCQTRAQRAYYRALQELRTLQTNRALRAIKLDDDIVDEVPAIADINELTKQTQSEVKAEALKLALEMVDYEAKTLQANAVRNRVGVPGTRPNPVEAALRL